MKISRFRESFMARHSEQKKCRIKVEACYLLLIIAFGIFAILSFSIISGCQGKYPTGPQPGPSPGPSPGPGPKPGPSIDYKYVATNILTPFCLSCHNSDFSLGGVDLSSFESTKNTGEKLCKVVEEAKMPPSEPLPEELVKKLCEWVSSGFPRYSPPSDSSILQPQVGRLKFLIPATMLNL